MPHYLDPKNDLTFKRVFGEHKHLCMSLINNMLPLKKPVVEIEYQTGELIPELTDVLRNTIVDIRCTDTNGRQFLVEMQLFWNESFRSRVLLNASKAYVMQLDKTKDFKLLKPVYALNLVNDTFDDSTEYYHHYQIVNINNTEKQIEGLEFFFVELPKFSPQNRAERKLHDLWLRFLTEINETTEEVPAELLEDDHIREAISYMERAAYTKAQLAAYDKWKIDTLTASSMLSAAKEEGLEEGEAIGLQKGEAERQRLETERQRLEAERQCLEAEKQVTLKLARDQAHRIAELEKLMSR
jgi:predicted transposase/invertase (TIGR01784 family)